MAQLAQAYVHLRRYDADPQRLWQLGESTKASAVEAVQQVYRGNVWVDIRIDEGSVFLRAGVLGAIAWLGLFGNYKGFKDSAVEAVHDAKVFSEWISKTFIEEARPKQSQIFRVERRTKTPGKILRLSKRLEELNQVLPRLSKRVREQQLEAIQKQFDEIKKDLSEEETKRLGKALRFENVPPLDEQIPTDEIPDEPRVAIRHPSQADFFDDAQEAAARQHLMYHDRVFVPPKGPDEAGTKQRVPVPIRGG
jgi:hypothetical protein